MHRPAGEQLSVLDIRLLTSKGAAVVTGSGVVTRRRRSRRSPDVPDRRCWSAIARQEGRLVAAIERALAGTRS